MLVLSVGDGVVGFTPDPNLGEFKLTHPSIRVPADTQEFAINSSNNSSNSRFSEPPVKRCVDECLAGKTGPRGKDFNIRWIANRVAEAHRIWMRGGVFMYPRDTKDPTRPGRMRLLYEAIPIGFLMAQADGRASTGRQPVLGVKPSALHQRIGLVFGSKHEVERIEPQQCRCLVQQPVGCRLPAQFAAVVCAEDAPLKKPRAQVYMLALQRLGVAALDAFALEDLRHGLQAAQCRRHRLRRHAQRLLCRCPLRRHGLGA